MTKDKTRKVGRNDPCPCGSGKKYKKCCLGKPAAPVSDDYISSEQRFDEEKFRDRISVPQSAGCSPTTPQRRQKRRKQHYVPIWYQKGFLPKGQKLLYCLDLQPYKKLPDGSQVKVREIYEQGPGSCFYKKDLYTTKFFGIRNEDIEKFLFGKIDNNGREGLHALVTQDFHKLSKFFQDIFTYMDAQKLRTPKGLDWIRSNYFQLSHLELMLEMQHLRTMHCTMWVEGVMEIVSAEDSDVKFIISDHPVTIYNPACPPNSKRCEYPNDPPTAWKASQTIFPLDLNHAFILTNLEYARDPDGVDPLIARTNPRYFAQTLTRWDIVIRDRKLKSEEVSAINYILKKRAAKYIAAAQQEWLYPEKSYSDNEWKSLHSVLLPPRHKIHMFGGEIYVGGENGKLAWYQDEFGRRHTSRENRDDPVQNYSIKRRNRILYNAILEIFGFSKGKDWDDFRKELTDDKIKEVYGVVGSLWNPDTEIMNLLPKPGSELSAFYSGTIDPRVIPITVLGYSLYVDRIIMISPFANPRVIKEEYSPFYSPSQYRDDTISNVFLMLQIMPLIDAGIVEMIPDPCDFDPYFRRRVYKMAEARMKGRGLSKDDMGHAEKLMRDDLRRSMLNLPPEALAHQMRKAMPDLSEEQIEEAVKYAQKEKLADPLAPLQPLTIGKNGAQLRIFRMSGNLETAFYLAQATGSYVYTDVKYQWREIQSTVLKRPDEHDLDPWAPVVQALDEVQFIMYPNLDPNFLCQIKENAAFKEFIGRCREICASARSIKDPEEASNKAKELAGRLKSVDVKSSWDMIDKEYKKIFGETRELPPQYKIKVPVSHLIPTNGLSTNTIVQILLTHGSNTPYWDAVPFAAFLDFEKIEPLDNI